MNIYATRVYIISTMDGLAILLSQHTRTRLARSLVRIQAKAQAASSQQWRRTSVAALLVGHYRVTTRHAMVNFTVAIVDTLLLVNIPVNHCQRTYSIRSLLLRFVAGYHDERRVC